MPETQLKTVFCFLDITNIIKNAQSNETLKNVCGNRGEI